MKICTKCKVPQSLDNFTTDRSKKDGLQSSCNTCQSRRMKDWYNKNKKKAQEQARKSYHKRKKEINSKRKLDRKLNPAENRKKARDYYKKNPIPSKIQSWKSLGIKNMTIARYNQLLIDQNYSCAICKTSDKDLNRKLDVDHDHKTGEVRGLLCMNCNQSLGRLKESPEIIMNLLKYVEKYTNSLGDGPGNNVQFIRGSVYTL